MSLKAVFSKHTLHFKFEAGTSRGVLTEKDSYFIKIFDTETPSVFGLGECAPLKGLSIDDRPDFELQLLSICEYFNTLDLEVFSWNLSIILDQVLDKSFPSIVFGFETAMLDLLNGGKRVIYDNGFHQNQRNLPINGLIWMGDKEFMLRQIDEKLAAGYTTIKMKVGAIDFEKECELLGYIRKHFSKDEITLRVDANGAFGFDTALEKLKRLSEYDLHSIEQPIKQGNSEIMAELCQTSPLPIALDEELIGMKEYPEKYKLLKKIMPQYIILKPSLVGGFQQCREWIENANRLKIGWWMTSALESNVGLNAITQFAAEFANPLPQGLGTGQLYHNNIPSPLVIEKGFMTYHANQPWDLSILNFLV
ncbi:o-succinylbenzoate synthase [Flectobacillus sp. DC10W]|uniref:O-succinylbenzoate synthase n=1 Tax=Flectobacillus longus TaxID=2984207 RepID=A0ABT6YLF8_9BACT|nr:o-succinylbenzoate synthase [Flectobacillus longus]MDI9864428.1 o-succinylbenzoate synthase [Flectobacillus longus]